MEKTLKKIVSLKSIRCTAYILNTVKIVLEVHALIEAHHLVLMPKMPIFQANLKKNEPLIDAHP